MNVYDLVKDHENEILKPYLDTAKPPKVTIGVGRNLSDKGIRPDESALMFKNDIAEAIENAKQYPWYAMLSDVRQAAVTDLIFNLGPTRFRAFTHFLAAMSARNYAWAADELMDSAWYRQVARRGPRIVSMIRNDRWPT